MEWLRGASAGIGSGLFMNLGKVGRCTNTAASPQAAQPPKVVPLGFGSAHCGWATVSSTSFSAPRSLRASRNWPLDELPTHAVESDSR